MSPRTDPDPSSADFFETMYRADPDPWSFACSEYEAHRYDATMAALAPRRYSRAFEPGCSVGVLTAQLATVCDAVEAIDFSPTAVDAARRRCASLGHVSIRCGALPQAMPASAPDLLVLSEIGYYFSAEGWLAVSEALVHALVPGGTLLAVHWLGTSPDHRLTGDEVHETLRGHPLLVLEHEERHAMFRLDRWKLGPRRLGPRKLGPRRRA